MKLVITEKPSVAQNIAKVIGAYKREDGYMEGGGYIVSWCIGHLVGLAQPESYDGRFRRWNIDDLPIIPDEWLWLTLPDKERIYEIWKPWMDRSLRSVDDNFGSLHQLIQCIPKFLIIIIHLFPLRQAPDFRFTLYRPNVSKSTAATG